MDRVKYYPPNDIVCGRNLKKVKKLIEKFKDYEVEEIENVNDVIELYNVKVHLDNEIYLKEWSKNDIDFYKDNINKIFGLVAKFFKFKVKDNFMVHYDKVQELYIEDFWELIEKFGIYQYIKECEFIEVMNSPEFYIGEILKHKNIVEHFGLIIRNYMLENPVTAEVLLHEYEIEHISKRASYNFPEELTNRDKEAIIVKYIESESPNLNNLRLIKNIQSNPDKIEISSKTLLKAKNKIENQKAQFFSDSFGFQLKISVEFSDDMNEERILQRKDNSLEAKYSASWIRNNLDFSTLLNNFIYLFDYVDMQTRIRLVNKFNEMNVFERFVILSSENSYRTGIEFNRKDILSLLQIKGYYNELFSLGIRLEEVIEWFFKEYLVREFKTPEFKLSMPSVDATMPEKCTTVIPAFEYVLKQFVLFVEEEKIDFDLLEIQSPKMVFKNVPSLVDKKYVYGVGKEYKTATFFLFSDQSGLGYNEKAKKTYNNCYELIKHEKLRLKDYQDYCIGKVNWLIDNEYLSTDNDEYIIFSDKNLIKTLGDLYFNEVVSYWHFPSLGRNIIDKLEEKNVVEFESTLFSRPEQDYLNFFLNKSQFNNGLDLRNIYVHTQPQIHEDDREEVHYNNYMIFLRIFILTIIKINDDFYKLSYLNSFRSCQPCKLS